MKNTIILLFHPNIKLSKTNASMQAAIKKIDGIEVVDMQDLYPDWKINVDVEVNRLLGAGRVIIQFPVQWYSFPPLLRLWQDLVLTRMFYVNYDNEGKILSGLPFIIAATAGNRPEAYTTEGVNLFPLDELLRPMHSMAHRCGLLWSNPFIAYKANQLSDSELESLAQQYVQHVKFWIANTETAPSRT